MIANYYIIIYLLIYSLVYLMLNNVIICRKLFLPLFFGTAIFVGGEKETLEKVKGKR